MRTGRPLKFKTIEELQAKIDAYFAYCDEHQEPYIVTGLAVFLDTSRETLLDYQGKKDFSDAITKAKEKCHAYAEKRLFGTTQVAGAIFNLKNNYGWKDKTETDVTSGGEKLQVNIVSYGNHSSSQVQSEDVSTSTP